MEKIAQIYQASISLTPPQAVVAKPPVENEVSKGWLMHSGTLVPAGARSCPECAGNAGPKANECIVTCLQRCPVLPTAVWGQCASPKWVRVGLWPARSFDHLGMEKFFAHAATMRKEKDKNTKKCDAAVEVAWSLCVGFEHCPVLGLSGIPGPPNSNPELVGHDGARYEEFRTEFIARYGPGQKQYPPEKELAEVFLASIEAVDDFKEENSVGSIETASRTRSGYFQRAPLGVDLKSLLDTVRNPEVTLKEKAKALVQSEYWTVFESTFLPRTMIAAIEYEMGGAKTLKSKFKAAEDFRWRQAAEYDRVSRQLEVERNLGEYNTMKATLDATLARRNECGAQLPEYPDDSTMHVFELFTDVLKEDKKVCKTSATHWRSKLVKTVVSTREKVEDGLVRTVSALEKAASKSCVRLLKVREKAASKWPKEERKTLEKRCKGLTRGCAGMSLQEDLNRDVPKHVASIVDRKTYTRILEVFEEHDAMWKTSIEKLHAADIQVRTDQQNLEKVLLEKVRVAREPNFVVACKQFEKAQRKEIKGYKFNGEDPGAAAFIREQEDLRSAHSTWFAEKSTVLAEHHAHILSLVNDFYDSVLKSVYPLHDFPIMPSPDAPWVPSRATSAQLASWIGRRSDRRMALQTLTAEPLSPSPSPLLDFKQDLDGRDDVALHPAVQIMQTKLDLGEITSEEFQIMLSIHKRGLELDDATTLEMESSSDDVGTTSMSPWPAASESSHQSSMPSFADDDDVDDPFGNAFESRTSSENEQRPGADTSDAPGNPFSRRDDCTTVEDSGIDAESPFDSHGTTLPAGTVDGTSDGHHAVTGGDDPYERFRVGASTMKKLEQYNGNNPGEAGNPFGKKTPDSSQNADVVEGKPPNPFA